MTGYQHVADDYADDMVVVMGKPAEDGWTGPHWAVELYNMNATSLVVSRHATQQEAEQQAFYLRLMLHDIIGQHLEENQQ